MESDVPHIHKLIYHLAFYHNLPLEATEASISNNLFKCNPFPPFKSLTGLILQVSMNPFPPISDYHLAIFDPVVQKVDLEEPIVDRESELFRSSGQEDFLCCGLYAFLSSLFQRSLEKPGLFIDHIYIRKCYRSLGFGIMLFSVVASHATKNGYSMVDQLVADWNVNSAKLFNKMGLQAVEDFRVSRLSGKRSSSICKWYP